jgi:quinol monooxygenase YgiN
MSYALINKMTTQTGKREEVIRIMLESGKAFDENPNCLLYLVSKDKSDPDVIWVQDIWTSQEAHSKAMSDSVMKEYVEQAMPLLDGMPVMMEIDLSGGKANFSF